ncbi:MAG: DinB family protein [Microlunatus sp.]|nr:DinB family protein [Microlunatus sp.]
MVADLKTILHAKLRQERANLLVKLDGLNEYDRRRPLTPTGTNLLGLIKHLAGLEFGYLGGCLGRPTSTVLPWMEDGSVAEGQDMWAIPAETSDYLIDLYRQACAHADRTITELDLDAPGHVDWWAPEDADTTLGFLLVRMVAETAHHAGHADIVRELIDGAAGNLQDPLGDDPAFWNAFYTKIATAADVFRA